MLGTDLKSDSVITFKRGMRENKRATRKTRNERSAENAPFPGTKAIATTRKSKPFQPDLKKRGPSAINFKTISIVKIVINAISTMRLICPTAAVHAGLVSKPN